MAWLDMGPTGWRPATQASGGGGRGRHACVVGSHPSFICLPPHAPEVTNMQAAVAASRAAWCPAAGAARRPARRRLASLRAADNDGMSWLDQQGELPPASLPSLVCGPPECLRAQLRPLICACAAAEATVQQDIVAEEAAALAEAGTCSRRPACQSCSAGAILAQPCASGTVLPAFQCAWHAGIPTTAGARRSGTDQHMPPPAAPLQPMTRWRARLACTSAAGRLSGKTTRMKATLHATSTTCG